MVIELRGVEFVNKGAELMLLAIIEKVREKYPQAIIAMELTHRIKKENLAPLKIYTKKGKRVAFLPKFIRRKLLSVHYKEIDVVLDGSGFAFGDQWGPDYADRKLGLKIEAWHKQGIKVILLPQAFGSFNDEKLKAIMKKIIANATLVFAREQQSYEYLKNISSSSNIALAPDFTNLIKGTVPQGFDAKQMQVAIIPNCKMVEGEKSDAQYIDFLRTAINKVMDVGLKPYILIHEGQGDIAIAEKVNTSLAASLQIVIHKDPLMIKGIISTAYFIICSRFHGVVSALSQGVPCISTSWSHKYEMLHQDYDYGEGLIKDISSKEEIEQKITALADPAFNKSISEKLALNSKQQKEKSAAMWDTVFEKIGA